MRVTIASRRSDLARIQAYQVGEALKTAYPQLAINYSFHESLGDRNQNDPLWQMPEKGVFTQDFRDGLVGGEFDLVVHSWKDLIIEENPETEIAATLPRADARDLLLVRSDRWEQVKIEGVLTVLTSSPRRSYNLETFMRNALPAKIREVRFTNVRGNVPTRVRKLFEQNVDGLIVAKAAVDRLLLAPQDEFATLRDELRTALDRCRWMVLPLRENPSAAAQGALAIEILRSRSDVLDLLVPLNSAETFAAVTREREILRGYGGGCHQKIGVSVLRRPFGEITFLRGLTDDGHVLDEYLLSSSQARPAKVPRERLWPISPFDLDLFTRERIETSSDSTSALWVARANALPDNWTPGDHQIIWGSGLRTWKRLARRGIWMNGCAEGLGEQEAPNIDAIAGSSLRWLKLTHASGYDEGHLTALATYRLVPKVSEIDLKGKTSFFWMSGSIFEYALSLNPWIKEMTHSCGPGNTRLILERNGLEPHVFLDHAQWLEEMSL
jgi:hydroxymethylbilane synthase